MQDQLRYVNQAERRNHLSEADLKQAAISADCWAPIFQCAQSPA